MLDYLPAVAPSPGGAGGLHAASGVAAAMSRETPDRALVEAARGGDRAAFGELVRRHQRRVHRLAFQLLGNAAEAEDAMQETFVRAYRALDRFDGRSEPFTWIYRITVNVSLNLLRSRRSRRVDGDTDDPRLSGALVEDRPGPADPGANAANRELGRALLDGVDALSETLRTTLILVVVDGLSHQDAAAVLGCPEGTVAWRIHEARRKLRLHLAASGQGGEGSP